MKARALFIVGVLTIITLSDLNAQLSGQTLTDSLLKQLPETKEDTNKVKLLVKIAESYKQTNISEGLKFAQQALEISRNSDHYTSLQRCFRVLADLSNSQGKSGEAFTYDSLWIRLARAHNDKWQESTVLSYIANDFAQRGNIDQAMAYWLQSAALKETITDTSADYRKILRNIGLAYRLKQDYPNSIKYYSKAAEVSHAQQDRNLEASSWRDMGVGYQLEFQYQRSIDAFNRALPLYTEKYDFAVLFNNIANTYQLVADYNKAIDYLLRSLKIAEEIKDPDVIGVDLNDITVSYTYNKEYDKALTCLLQAEKIFDVKNNKYFIAAVNMNIGEVLFAKKDYAKALGYAKYAQQLFTEINDRGQAGIAIHNQGNIYSEEKSYGKALRSFFNALPALQEAQDKKVAAECYVGIGKAYLTMARNNREKGTWEDSLAKYSKTALLSRSVLYLKRSLALSAEIGLVQDMQEEYNLLSQAQEMAGDSKSALESYKQYNLLKDSVFNLDNAKAFVRKDMAYEYDKKETAIKAESDKQLTLAAVKNKENIRTGLFLGSTFVLLLSGGFYINRKREQSRFRLQQMQLRQDALKARLDTHFVSGTLVAINEFAESNDPETASDYLLKFSRLIRNVLINSFEKAVPLKNEIQFMNDYFLLAKLRYPKDHVAYHLDMDPDIDMENTLVPPMIFQVLVENALQHAFNDSKGGLLSVGIRKSGHVLLCTVEDNGVGRKTVQSLNEKGRVSYGSSLAERLLKVWQPDDKDVKFEIEDLVDENGKAKGTKASFSFPLQTL